MRWLLSRFLILLGALACWIAFLALGVRPDYSKWANYKLVTLHFLPPIGMCLAWWFGRWYVSDRKQSAPEAQHNQTEAAMQTVQDPAHSRVEQRRQYCDCRLLAINDLAIHEMLELSESRSVAISMMKADEKSEELASQDTRRVLDAGIAEALGYIYAECGAAAALPIYLVAPADIAAKDAIEHVRMIAARLIFDMKLPVKLKADAPLVMAMPSRGSASNSVLGLFESIPELPAAVVLAFDSSMSQLSLPVTKPGHGVFALLVTAADLPAMLDAAGTDDDPSRGHYSGSGLPLLASLPQLLRDELRALGSVARIYRAATGKIDDKSGQLVLTSLLEQAQLHASAPGQAAESRCEWLVHNTGESKHAGGRLASIAGALMHRKIDLKPIEMATDMVRHVGHLGQASPIGLLAVALVQAQGKQGPVLCAEFAEPNGIAIAFATPHLS
ncbi:hypothetical protein [Pseudoduganella sp. R-34]|uniref:hypothetical protein n=1 Tax=Pseudoduganella sp. R-34 TaxID=3404062 RepID=UPI003CE9ECE3